MYSKCVPLMAVTGMSQNDRLRTVRPSTRVGKGVGMAGTAGEAAVLQSS